jgi:hypothetical protein
VQRRKRARDDARPPFDAAANRGVDALVLGLRRSGIHISSGGNTPAQNIPVGPSYQVPLARAVKVQ